MAHPNTSDYVGGNPPFMAFVLGALIIAVSILGYFAFMDVSPESNHINLTIEALKK